MAVVLAQTWKTLATATCITAPYTVLRRAGLTTAHVPKHVVGVSKRDHVALLLKKTTVAMDVAIYYKQDLATNTRARLIASSVTFHTGVHAAPRAVVAASYVADS